MHNNYYFLKRLVPVLHDKLLDSQLVECFTQNKNELIIIFSNNFVLKAYLDPSFCCLTFPTGFHRAKKNSVDLFHQLRSKGVLGLTQFENERCFSIDFSDNLRLLFKMHGNRSNVILFYNKEVKSIFKNSLKKDWNLLIHQLDRPIDQSFRNFNSNNGDYRELFPTFGPLVKKYLDRSDYQHLETQERWELLQNTIKKIETGNLYTCNAMGSTYLSLLKIGSVLETFDSPIESVNHFFNYKIQKESLEKEKTAQLKKLKSQIHRTTSYIETNRHKLNAITKSTDYSKIADILMANLHQIPKGVSFVELQNFYSNNQLLTIKLKKDLTAQKNAENYYRKFKNQSKELNILKTNITRKEELLRELHEEYERINALSDIKELRKAIKQTPSSDKPSNTTPYSEFDFMGYKIRIGKNAKSNDTMLRNFTQKNDLWLHAKDISGSHVIIKEIPGSKFPKPVIEKAAEVAAYHSKKRNDSLCPVIYTPRKYVRKRKGDPHGAVVVEKEEVVLVQPKNYY